MFQLFKKKNLGKNKHLNELIQDIEMNAENNYKDAAQQAFRTFRSELEQMLSENLLSVEQAEYYKKRMADFEKQMAGYTHKDQKCTW